MRIFPQLSTGAFVQYPLQKRRTTRTILNVSEDGRITALADVSASRIRWDLRFEGLTDTESNKLSSFFEDCEGALQAFTFLDPSANLLAFSEDLSQAVWQRNSLVKLTTGIGDPFGGTSASRLTNASQASLAVTQTVQMPGSVWSAFSVYMRMSNGAPGGSGFALGRTDGSTSSSVAIRPNAGWNRFSASTAFASSQSATCDFSLTIPVGASVDVFGFQVDSQSSPGKYVKSAAITGVYPNSRFDSNLMTVDLTGPGQSSARVAIVSNSSE